MHGSNQLGQVGDLRRVGLGAGGDMLIHHLFKVAHLGYQLLILLVELLVLLGQLLVLGRQLLDAVGLGMVAYSPNIGGDQQHRSGERCLKA